jgi:uncharacterized protein (TIGR02996 family)
MQEDLLRAVLAAPDDPAPRLVYADALMRSGDPRGEFIALQCAGKPEATELLENHRAEWLAVLPHVVSGYFERGFVTAATIALNHQNLSPAFAALDREPIRSVTFIVDDEEDFEHLDVDAKASWLMSDDRRNEIRALDLTFVRWGEQAIARLLAARWSALRELHIGDADCIAHTLHRIADGSQILTTLGFHGDYCGYLDDDIGILVNSENAVSLRTLLVEDCGLTVTGARTIARSPCLTNLEQLSLIGSSYQANHVEDDGALAIARSQYLNTLTHLSLVNNRVTDAFVGALADGSLLPLLTSLAVNSCTGITSTGFSALVTSPRMSTIEELWVGGCSIDDAGVAALARSAYTGSLRALNLHGNPLTVEGARLLADSPLATQLVHLSFALTPLTEAILRPVFGDRLNRG